MIRREMDIFCKNGLINTSYTAYTHLVDILFHIHRISSGVDCVIISHTFVEGGAASLNSLYNACLPYDSRTIVGCYSR